MGANKGEAGRPAHGNSAGLDGRGLIHLHLLLWDLAVGGAERFALDLFRHLVRRSDTRVSATCLGSNDTLLEQVPDAVDVRFLNHRPVTEWTGSGRVFHPARGWRLLPLLGNLSRRVRHLKPDLLFSALDVCNLPGAMAFRQAPVRTLVTSRVTIPPPGPIRWLSRLYHLPSDRLSDAIICNTGQARNAVRDGWPSPAGPVLHLPTGVDTTRFRPRPTIGPRLRGELGLPADVPILGCVARLHPVKGQDLLLQALSVLRDLPWHLLLVGPDQGFEPVLQQRVEACNLNGRVRFLGLRHDVDRLLNLLDLVLIPSRQEGLPNVLLQAMATGRPVIGTDVGGMAEGLKDEKTGRLVPPGNPEALAAAIKACLEDEETRKEYGKRARKEATTHFDRTTCLKKYEALFRSLARRR